MQLYTQSPVYTPAPDSGTLHPSATTNNRLLYLHNNNQKNVNVNKCASIITSLRVVRRVCHCHVGCIS